MAVYPGTFIPTGLGTTDRRKYLIDNLMTPRLLSFRQIRIMDEPSELKPDGQTWAATYGNWLSAAPLVIRKNGQVIDSVSIVSLREGTYSVGGVDLGADGRPRDVVEATYWFDYFPFEVLEGLFVSAISIVNMTAIGPPTHYTLENFPKNWEGVVTDLAFAHCMERMLLDWNLWRYRLVFAIGPGEVYEGNSGDIVSQLETLKQNAEERANLAMQNEKFKTGNYLAPPTVFYFNAIRGLGGAVGRHGIPFLSGRLRGWKPNRYI